MNKFTSMFIVVALIVLGVYLTLNMKNNVSATSSNPKALLPIEIGDKDNPIANCKMDFPLERMDDFSFNENSTAGVGWWDEKLNNNVKVIISFGPEVDLTKCSDSGKQLIKMLRSLKKQDNYPQ